MGDRLLLADASFWQRLELLKLSGYRWIYRGCAWRAWEYLFDELILGGGGCCCDYASWNFDRYVIFLTGSYGLMRLELSIVLVSQTIRWIDVIDVSCVCVQRRFVAVPFMYQRQWSKFKFDATAGRL